MARSDWWLSLFRDDVPQRKFSDQTSVRQVPSVYKSPSFQRCCGPLNFDLGGGKYDDTTAFLRGIGVESLIYDPYARTLEHNRAVVERIAQEPCDTACAAHVLNVIAEPLARRRVVERVAAALAPHGTGLFQIYVGDKSGKGKDTALGWQENRAMPTYLPSMFLFFEVCVWHGDLIVCRGPIEP